jgi:hypothetical protein
MGNRFRNRGTRDMGLQVRQTSRQPSRLRGRSAAPGSLMRRSHDALPTLRTVWLYALAAAVVAMPLMGSVWPAVAVCGGWLLNRMGRRR